MSAGILDWAAAAAAGASRAGGKGWQLGCMDQLGVPVPPGFILEAGASTHAELRTILSMELNARGWSGRALAIRSSATAEDSARASFAGIYLSRLNVKGVDGAVQAVRDVVDSQSTPQALAYRERMGLADGDTAMAVVVMPLLPAVASGIIFTSDPVSGRDDQMLIHAHWGLGEALVGGHAEGDEYHLQESHIDDSLQLVERRIGSKARVTVPVAAGGTTLQDTGAARAAKPVLSEAQALVLGAIAKDAASALDYANPAYDIEWVWDGEHFWIVQARPITARARHTYPGLIGQPDYWTRGNTRDIVPEPLSPLDWNLCRTMVNRMLNRGFELSGYATLPGAQYAALFHGRLYLHSTLIQWVGYDALGVPAKVMNQLLGGEQAEISVPPATPRQRLARGLRIVRYLQRTSSVRKRAGSSLAKARQAANGSMAQELPATNAELAQQLRLQFASLRGADDLFFLQGSAGGNLYNLIEMVEKYLPGEGHALTGALMAGGAHSVTATQGYELMDLARVAASDGPALAWLRQPGRLNANWERDLAPDSPFLRAFRIFMQRYGHRGVYETYLRSPRWRESPGYLLDSVLNLIGCDPAPLRERQRPAADAAWRKVSAAMPFWLRPLAAKLSKTSKSDCNDREAARSAIVALQEVLRRGACALGERFAASGGLEQASDIFNLTALEIFALAEGKLAPAAAARRACQRRRQLALWAAQIEPGVVTLHGDAAPATDAATIDVIGDAWTGSVVSGGRASGKAHIARSPGEGLTMAAGDVLVVPSTDPAWTPLFLKAGALVMESGGYLSHGAIVAREFGIPAVIKLPGILDRLHAGDQVEVDGNRGTVRRLSPSI